MSLLLHSMSLFLETTGYAQIVGNNFVVSVLDFKLEFLHSIPDAH